MVGALKMNNVESDFILSALKNVALSWEDLKSSLKSSENNYIKTSEKSFKSFEKKSFHCKYKRLQVSSNGCQFVQTCCSADMHLQL